MRYVLLLQGEKVSAFAVGRGVLGAPVVFENSPQDRGKFTLYLRERYGALFTVVLDSKDEEHHVDSIPNLKRGDRTRMLLKLQQRYFSGDSLSAVTMSDISRTAGKTLPVTVSGLSEGSDCDCWLGVLRETSTLIASMYSLPLLGLAIHNARGSSSSLCAVQVGQGDFRLLAYKNGRLLISRYLVVSEQTSEPLLEQLQNTQNYLDRLQDESSTEGSVESRQSPTKLTQTNWGVDSIWVIGAFSAKNKATLEDHGIRVSSCRNLPKILKLKFQLESPFGDTVFAALALSGNNRPARFSMGSYRHSIQVRRVRHLLFAGFMCCFGITAVAAAAAAHINQTYSSLATTASTLGSSSRNIASVPSVQSEMPVDAIRESLNLSRYLSARTHFTPRHFLYAFAADLTVYPELEVTGINWSRVDRELSDSLIEPMVDSRRIVVNGSDVLYNARVTGYIQTKGAERVAALSRFNSFISTLTDAGRYSSVKVVEAPFGIGDDALTKGGGKFKDREKFVITLDVREEGKL